MEESNEETQRKINEFKKDCEGLKAQLADLKKGLLTGDMKQCSANEPKLGKLPIKQRKVLKGHIQKIYAMHWAEDSTHLVSASQDGKMICWEAVQGHKTHAIPLRSSWVMTCAYAPSGNFVASGGLDNICSIYNLKSGGGAGVARELNFHTGYLSCCRFIDDTKILTSSGDLTCVLWDIEKSTPINVFTEHQGDVMSLSIMNENTFVSGGCDTVAKLWDIRTGKSVQTHPGHDSDINAIQSHSAGYNFVTGSDTGSSRLYDTRADAEINLFQHNSITCGITSVAFSISGRLVFGGYDDFNCYVWDTFNAEKVLTLDQHDNRVSCLGVAANGNALATGSWDQYLKLWA